MTRYAPLWLQAGSYAAGVDRRLIAALWPLGTVNGMAVSAGTGMQLNVAAGSAAVPSSNNTGSVLCVSDAVEPVTLTAAPAAGNNRIDVLYILPRGNDLDGGVNNDFIFAAVAGVVTTGVATVPAVPTGALALANIAVAGGVSSIVAGNITDVRPTYRLAVPQSLPWGVAWGEVPGSRKVNTSNSAAISGPGAIGGMTLTATLTNNRQYRHCGMLTIQNSAASSENQLFTYYDGAQTQRLLASQQLAGRGSGFYISTPFNGDGASHTWQLWMASGAGGGTVTALGAANLPAYMWIDDIGPVPGTTGPYP